MKSVWKKCLAAVMAGGLALFFLIGTAVGAAADEPQITSEPVISEACMKPVLGLNQGNIYWASFADYTIRLLSVDIMVPNLDVVDANDVSVVGARTLAGATLNNLPLPVGDIAVGATSPVVTLKYSVPPGVNAFATYLYGTAQDTCGNTYYYPGPFQGV